MADIFRKTTLGYEEVANRAHHLNSRLRRCLILVDGKRNIRDLMLMFNGEDISPFIQTLEIEGYIELAGSAAAPPVRLGQSLSSLDIKTTMQMASMGNGFDDSQPLFVDSDGQLRRPLSLGERQLRASRVINDLLGPNAEDIALKIEVCKDNASLEQVLRVAAVFIADTVNLVAAKRFKDHVRLTDEPV
jgi:hypothetical protein